MSSRHQLKYIPRTFFNFAIALPPTPLKKTSPRAAQALIQAFRAAYPGARAEQLWRLILGQVVSHAELAAAGGLISTRTTRAQLAQLLGHKDPDTVTHHLRDLQAAGLVKLLPVAQVPGGGFLRVGVRIAVDLDQAWASLQRPAGRRLPRARAPRIPIARRRAEQALLLTLKAASSSFARTMPNKRAGRGRYSASDGALSGSTPGRGSETVIPPTPAEVRITEDACREADLLPQDGSNPGSYAKRLLWLARSTKLSVEALLAAIRAFAGQEDKGYHPAAVFYSRLRPEHPKFGPAWAWRCLRQQDQARRQSVEEARVEGAAAARALQFAHVDKARAQQFRSWWAAAPAAVRDAQLASLAAAGDIWARIIERNPDSDLVLHQLEGRCSAAGLWMFDLHASLPPAGDDRPALHLVMARFWTWWRKQSRMDRQIHLRAAKRADPFSFPELEQLPREGDLALRFAGWAEACGLWSPLSHA